MKQKDDCMSVCQKCGTPLEPANVTLQLDGTLMMDGAWNFNNMICPNCHVEFIKEKLKHFQSQSEEIQQKKYTPNWQMICLLLQTVIMLLQWITSLDSPPPQSVVGQVVQQIIIVEYKIDHLLDATDTPENTPDKRDDGNDESTTNHEIS